MSGARVRRREGGGLLTAWGFGLAVVEAALAAVIAWPVYRDERVVLVAAVAGILALLLVLAARWLRWPFWLTALVAALVYVVAVGPSAIPASLNSMPELLDGARDGVLGVAVGWKQLVTLTLPLGHYQAVLVPLFFTIFAGTLLTATLATLRGRAAALAVLPALAMAAFGIVFGSSSTSGPARFGVITVPAPHEIAAGLAVVLVAFGWLAVRSRMLRSRALRAGRGSTGATRRRAPFWASARRTGLAVGIVVVALVGALVVAPAAAGFSPRTALRDGIEPVVDIQAQPSPLNAYRSWFESDAYDTPLFTVDGDDSGVQRVTLATLSHYDGREFTVGDESRFTRLPRTAATSQSDGRVTITIESGYTGVWVPLPRDADAAPSFGGGRGERLSDSFYVGEDEATAVAVLEDSDGGRGLRAGDSYTVPTRPAGTDPDFAEEEGGRSLIEETAYPKLAAWVKQQKTPRTGAGLVELFTRLRDRGYLTHSLADDANAEQWIAGLSSRADYAFESAYAGHSRARIAELFDTLSTQQLRAGPDADPEALVSAAGDDEQFAVAAALLARYLGFDSRVALGVRLGRTGANLGVPPCTSVCRGQNMAAWVEVRGADGAWLPFDVTPQFAQRPVDVERSEQLPENPTVPQYPHSDTVDPPSAQGDTQSTSDDTDHSGQDALTAVLPVLRFVGAGLLGLALLALPFLVLLAAKAWRRRSRRRAATGELRIVGAWEELLDLYADHRMRVRSAGTRAQVAAELGRPLAALIAADVDRAVFAEHPPAVADADRTWRHLDDERETLAASATFWSRLRAAVTPRSLLARLRPPVATGRRKEVAG